MVWLEQVITQLVCLSFVPSSTCVFLFFAFPVNHFPGCSYWNKPMHLEKTHRKWYCYLLIPHWLSGDQSNSKECSVHYEKWDIAAVSSCSEMCPLIVMNEFFFGPHELELACWEITSHKNSLITIPLEEVIVWGCQHLFIRKQYTHYGNNSPYWTMYLTSMP